MKTILTLIFIGFLSLTTNAQEFKFDTEIIDYGKIDKKANGVRLLHLPMLEINP